MSVAAESVITFDTVSPVVQQMYLKTIQQVYGPAGDAYPPVMPGYGGATYTGRHGFGDVEPARPSLIRPLTYRNPADTPPLRPSATRYYATAAVQPVDAFGDTGMRYAPITEPYDYDYYGNNGKTYNAVPKGTWNEQVDAFGDPDDAAQIARLEALWGISNDHKAAPGMGARNENRPAGRARTEQVWHTEDDKPDRYSNTATQQLFQENARGPLRRHRAESGRISRFMRRTASMLGYTMLVTADSVAAVSLWTSSGWHI